MSTTNGKANRDATGRFKPGHAIKSPGRPSKQIEREYLQAFSRGCPPERLARIVDTMAGKAEKGSIEAAKLILRHALPVAAMRVELLGDGEEFRVAGRTPSEVDREMIERINRLVRERAEREESLRSQGRPEMNHHPKPSEATNE